jgi:hypothetical protein
MVVNPTVDLLNCSGYIQGRCCFSGLYYGVRTRPGWWLIIFSLMVTVNALSIMFVSMMDESSGYTLLLGAGKQQGAANPCLEVWCTNPPILTIG